MYKRVFILLLTLTFTMFMTVACSNTKGEDGAQNNGEEPRQTEEDENDVDDLNSEENKTELDDEQSLNDDNDMNENDEYSSSNDNNGSPSSIEIPEPIVLNERVQHPNGITFTLEKITFNEDYITVHIEVLNGRQRTIRLAEYMKEEEQLSKEGAILVDDTGYEYRFIGPEGDPRITVGANEKMTGAITFIGQLSEDATALSLTFNPEHSEDDPNTDNPKFEFKDIKIKR